MGSSNPPYRLGRPTVAVSTTWTLKAAVPAANRVASGLDVDNTAPTSPARYVPQKARREHGRAPNSSANGTHAGSGRNRRVAGDGGGCRDRAGVLRGARPGRPEPRCRGPGAGVAAARRASGRRRGSGGHVGRARGSPACLDRAGNRCCGVAAPALGGVVLAAGAGARRGARGSAAHRRWHRPGCPGLAAGGIGERTQGRARCGGARRCRQPGAPARLQPVRRPGMRANLRRRSGPSWTAC